MYSILLTDKPKENFFEFPYPAYIEKDESVFKNEFLQSIKALMKIGPASVVMLSKDKLDPQDKKILCLLDVKHREQHGHQVFLDKFDNAETWVMLAQQAAILDKNDGATTIDKTIYSQQQELKDLRALWCNYRLLWQLNNDQLIYFATQWLPFLQAFIVQAKQANDKLKFWRYKFWNMLAGTMQEYNKRLSQHEHYLKCLSNYATACHWYLQHAMLLRLLSYEHLQDPFVSNLMTDILSSLKKYNLETILQKDKNLIIQLSRRRDFSLKNFAEMVDCTFAMSSGYHRNVLTKLAWFNTSTAKRYAGGKNYLQHRADSIEIVAAQTQHGIFAVPTMLQQWVLAKKPALPRIFFARALRYNFLCHVRTWRIATINSGIKALRCSLIHKDQAFFSIMDANNNTASLSKQMLAALDEELQSVASLQKKLLPFIHGHSRQELNKYKNYLLEKKQKDLVEIFYQRLLAACRHAQENKIDVNASLERLFLEADNVIQMLHKNNKLASKSNKDKFVLTYVPMILQEKITLLQQALSQLQNEQPSLKQFNEIYRKMFSWQLEKLLMDLKSLLPKVLHDYKLQQQYKFFMQFYNKFTAELEFKERLNHTLTSLNQGVIPYDNLEVLYEYWESIKKNKKLADAFYNNQLRPLQDVFYSALQKAMANMVEQAVEPINHQEEGVRQKRIYMPFVALLRLYNVDGNMACKYLVLQNTLLFTRWILANAQQQINFLTCVWKSWYFVLVNLVDYFNINLVSKHSENMLTELYLLYQQMISSQSVEKKSRLITKIGLNSVRLQTLITTYLAEQNQQPENISLTSLQPSEIMLNIGKLEECHHVPSK